MASDGAAVLRRVAQAVVIGGAIWFAVQGGEFGSLDLLRQRQQRQRVLASIDSLQDRVDLLKRYEDKLVHDPATQERIAREVFGMVRGDKEILYRFAEPRDTTHDPARDTSRITP